MAIYRMLEGLAHEYSESNAEAVYRAAVDALQEEYGDLYRLENGYGWEEVEELEELLEDAVKAAAEELEEVEEEAEEYAYA